MTEIIIPFIDIRSNKPVSETVIKFCMDYGFYYGFDFGKEAHVEINDIHYEFFELQDMLVKDDMKIKIIQEG